jgi:chloramphenicol 3-O-phosphotransferase
MPHVFGLRGVFEVLMSTLPIFIISGCPGAGKSSLAKALLQRFDFGFYIAIDDLREQVVAGIAHPVPQYSEETARQFALAHAAAVANASIYAKAGFAVAIDDVIFPASGEQLIQQLAGFRVLPVLLLPELAVALARNASRSNKNFDTSVLAPVIEQIHGVFTAQIESFDSWLILDNSHITNDEAVEVVLEHFGL